jgi:hypothetical protein
MTKSRTAINAGPRSAPNGVGPWTGYPPSKRASVSYAAF